jgi:hypothetical protein
MQSEPHRCCRSCCCAKQSRSYVQVCRRQSVARRCHRRQGVCCIPQPPASPPLSPRQRRPSAPFSCIVSSHPPCSWTAAQACSPPTLPPTCTLSLLPIVAMLPIRVDPCCTSYSTNEPQSQFHKRIGFCLELHNRCHTTFGFLIAFLLFAVAWRVLFLSSVGERSVLMRPPPLPAFAAPCAACAFLPKLPRYRCLPCSSGRSICGHFDTQSRRLSLTSSTSAPRTSRTWTCFKKHTSSSKISNARLSSHAELAAVPLPALHLDIKQRA